MRFRVELNSQTLRISCSSDEPLTLTNIDFGFRVRMAPGQSSAVERAACEDTDVESLPEHLRTRNERSLVRPTRLVVYLAVAHIRNDHVPDSEQRQELARKRC